MREHILLTITIASLLFGCDSETPVPTTPSNSNPITPASGAGATNTAGSAAPAPNATAGAYLGGAAIGVSDLEKSQEFYTSVLGMSLRYALPVPGYVNERILYFKDGKGADVVLMNFVDGMVHNYTKNPVKLVFYVPNAKATLDAIRARGLDILSEAAPQPAFGNAVVGFGRDPDGYALEIIEASTVTVPYLGAIGIGVSDLEKTKAFYTSVLGMQQMGDLIKVPGVWDEYLLVHPSGKGSTLVLMHYTDGAPRNYTNIPVKTVHFVPDARATAEKVAAAGLPVISQPMIFDVLGTKSLISLTRDPDGYTVELVTPQPAAGAQP